MFATSSSCLPSPRRDCHLLDGIVPMERSASSYNFKFQTRVMCLCNVKAPLVTLWTKDNPRRHFYGCGLYGVRNSLYCWFHFGLCVDFFCLFCPFRLQVENGVNFLSGTIQLSTVMRRGSL